MHAPAASRSRCELRPRLADLFFDIRPDSARIRHDFFNTTTELYTNAYYRQLRQWCREHGWGCRPVAAVLTGDVWRSSQESSRFHCATAEAGMRLSISFAAAFCSHHIGL